MDKARCILFLVATLAACSASAAYAWDGSTPLIIDHHCAELSHIPMAWIDSVQANMKFHFAHTSHGSQLRDGLYTIEDEDFAYSFAYMNRSLPEEPGAFCIFNGQEHDTYITPDEYWMTETGMNYTRDVLDHNPTINVSTFAWCSELNSYSEGTVQAYLDSITVLESEYPDVTFIYMTGNAQGTDAEGYNRFLRNEQIRQYCLAYNKVLYDFADLDCWWFDSTTGVWEMNYYEYEGDTIPVEHPEFTGSNCSHANLASCYQKGEATWWVMARLAGWQVGIADAGTGGIDTSPFTLGQNYPNPFSGSTVIHYSLRWSMHIELSIYNIAGQLVRMLHSGAQEHGPYNALWNGHDTDGTPLASGIYFYRLTDPSGRSETRKMILLK
ncbi:MAG: T9SS type A sorting domain-containing protein [bacterium]|nr:MAG: T9SS type A sorting domain-containing protein [bacterium]